MPPVTITFDYDHNDRVLVNSTQRVGVVGGLQLGPGGVPIYFVRGGDAAGLPADAWRNRSEIADWIDAPATVISRIEYFQLFTPDEQLAITSSDIPQVKLIMAALSMVDKVDLATAPVRDSLDGLVAMGLLTLERAARIKTGQPPVTEPTPPASPEPDPV